MKKIIYVCTIVLGLFIIVGTVGAMDLGNIQTKAALFNILKGSAICLLGNIFYKLPVRNKKRRNIKYRQIA